MRSQSGDRAREGGGRGRGGGLNQVGASERWIDRSSFTAGLATERCRQGDSRKCRPCDNDGDLIEFKPKPCAYVELTVSDGGEERLEVDYETVCVA